MITPSCIMPPANPDWKAIELLLAKGANPHVRTNIADFTTPLEEAEQLGWSDAARLLRNL